MLAYFSKAYLEKIQNLSFLKQSLAFFSYKLLATLACVCVCPVVLITGGPLLGRETERERERERRGGGERWR